MELFIELVQFIGERIAANLARKPKTRASKVAFQRNFRVLKQLLSIAILVVSIILPAYFFYDGYTSGNLSKEYFYFGVALVFITFISHLFTFANIRELFHQEVSAGAIYEASTIEDDIRYETGLLALLTVLSAIPILNLIVNSLVIQRALNILEITLNNSQRQKIRELAGNIAFSSLLIFLVSSVVFSIVLVVLGDARQL